MKNDTLKPAAPVLLKIGKTIYSATEVATDAPSISRAWKLVATKGPKQEKSLFESSRDGQFTLWSAPNGSIGRRATGMPKLVEVQFMGDVEAATA